MLLARRGILSGGAAWSPLELDNQKHFVDFRDSNSYTEISGKVSAIHDLYSLAPDMTQSIVGNRAVITNGEMIFNAVEFYAGGTSYYDFLHNGSDWSIYIALESELNNALGTLFSNNGAAASVIGIALFIDDRVVASRNDSLVLGVTNGNAGSPVVQFSSVDNVVDQNVFTKNAVLFDYTNATVGNPVADMYKDGSFVGDVNLFSKTATASSATITMKFGGDPGSGFFDGKIKGFVIVSDILTSEEISNLDTYFT